MKQAVIKNNPKLRFPKFKYDLQRSVLMDYFTRITEKNRENNKNVLTISAQSGLINQEDFFNKSVAASNLKGYYLLHKGDFAYNKSYSNGYPMGAIKKFNSYDKGIVSTLYICFRIKENNSKEFFEQYFNSGLQNKEIQKIAQEGARNHGLLNIGIDDFFNIKLTIPKTLEQQKIADFLILVDERTDGLYKKIELLKKYKKGMTQKIFSQKIRFKDENKKDYPTWEEKKIGQIYKQREERYENGLELLSVSINSGIQKKNNIEDKDNSSEDKSNYKKVCKGDIAYNTMRMWQGASGVSDYEGIVSPAYTVLAGNENINSKFFGYYFKLSRMIYTFERYSQGLTSDTWNLKYPQLSQIKIKVPSLSEQEKIADFLTVIDEKIQLEKRRLVEAKKFKKSLLQQMFV